ncbi:growth arrest and DNA damage-inducible protein GADD45 alpha-like [Contarinia nasturtii]|uniref:growth arrest and DNA damage-inducible protein GADD45 alpha-like n=1 Tax=Contarinia nasturtii TaxID=265458 RepID=UPI0012D403F8|nr:growth arrest and DNA damage-inducible protein GADD45 alpha-like [Contarinia nasturtii]
MVATNYLSEAKKPMVSIGHKIRAALWCAQVERRLIIGLNEAVKMLSKAPNNSLFCILAPANGDTSTHIQEVLLEAYCYENDIYIIKVDAAEKLTRILGTRRPESCCLIQKSVINAADITAIEGELIDYCEEIWNEPNETPIDLP